MDLLFIENVGNLICPVGFDLGQTVKVGLFSLTEGDDKAAKHPYLVTAADLLLLNKIEAIAVDQSGNGYWLVGADGGVYAFGDAAFFGSAARQYNNEPFVGITAS